MNYSKAKIYIIRNKVNNKVYVGATSIDLQKCLAKQYEISRQICRFNFPLSRAFSQIGFDNFFIELIEDYPCVCQAHLNDRKDYYIKEFDSVRNGYNNAYHKPKIKSLED